MKLFVFDLLGSALSGRGSLRTLSLKAVKKSNLIVNEVRLTSSRAAAVQEFQSDEQARLNNLVGEAVFQGLSHFGGKNVVESLIYILELEHSVNLRNIVNELEVLRSGLAKMFGNASYVVEQKVRNNLAKKLGLDPEGRSLEQLVEAAKKSLQEDSSQNPKSD